MNEFVKDAPCLCKEDWQDKAQTTMKLSFGEKVQFYLLRLQKSRFVYPVMYEDGTVSTKECDKIGRTPVGIIFNNHLLSLKVSQNKMPWNEAMDYCKSVKLLGKECDAGTVNFWLKFRSRKKEINKIFYSLGAKPLSEVSYWTSEKSGKEAVGWIYDREIWQSQSDKYYAFPMLDLSDKYAYPVMYADGTISTLKSDKAGRMPLGVIFENHLITMKDSPYAMSWKKAMNYCKSIKLLGEKCEAGTAEFWNNLDRPIKNNINEIFSSLDGEVLGKHLYWTSTSHWYEGRFTARYLYDTSVSAYRQKDECLLVRPVLDLSKVSL